MYVVLYYAYRLLSVRDARQGGACELQTLRRRSHLDHDLHRGSTAAETDDDDDGVYSVRIPVAVHRQPRINTLRRP